MDINDRGPRGPRHDPDNGRIFHNVAILTLVLVAIIIALILITHAIPGVR